MAFCVAIGHAKIFHYAPQNLLPALGIAEWRGAAVHYFFMLSGFFIHHIITQKFYGKKRWIAAFYHDRALRLTPCYWLAASATFVALLFTYPIWAKQFSGNIAVLLSENIFLFNPELLSPALHRASYHLAIPQAWALELELLFLIIAPWVMTLSKRGLILAMALSLTVSGYYYAHGVFRPHFYAELVYFIWGAGAYRIYLALKPRQAAFQHLMFPAYALIAIIVAWRLEFDAMSAFIGSDGAYIGLIILLWATMPLFMLVLPKSPTERFLNNMAYPFYLVHLLVYHLVTLTGLLPREMAVYPGMLISLALAALLVRYVDYPIARYRRLLEKA